MTSITRFVQSLVAATIAVAIVFAGSTCIANAAPANQSGPPANVVVTMPASAGSIDETPGQSWISMFRIADHGMYTGTAQAALKAVDIGARGHHVAEPRGNRQFVANGVVAGDYLLIGHFGAKTLVMNAIHSVALGDQYGPSQTDQLTWTGTAMGASSMAAPQPVTVRIAKTAAPLGTPLCVVTASKPTTTTGSVTIVSGGTTWVGKVVFVPVNAKLLRVEEGQALAKKMAADPKSDKVLNFMSVPDGTNMRLGSGDYQVYRLTAGDPAYLGYLQASPNGTHNTVTTVNGTCAVYDLKLLRTPTTGSALNLSAILMVAFGLFGFGWLNRGRLTFVRLPLTRG